MLKVEKRVGLFLSLSLSQRAELDLKWRMSGCIVSSGLHDTEVCVCCYPCASRCIPPLCSSHLTLRSCIIQRVHIILGSAVSSFLLGNPSWNMNIYIYTYIHTFLVSPLSLVVISCIRVCTSLLASCDKFACMHIINVNMQMNVESKLAKSII